MDRRSRIRRKRRIRRNIQIFLICTVVTLGGFLAVHGFAGDMPDGETKKRVEDTGRQDLAAAAAVAGEPGGTDRQLTEQQLQVRQIFDTDKSLLVLVNKEHPLPADYDAGLRKICNGRLEASDIMYDDLVEMLAAGEDAGYTYWIASAHRSRERQERLMEEEIEKNMRNGLSREEAEKKSNETLMSPGYSEHETGLALDILCSGNMSMDLSQASEKGNVWLRENGWKYGFVLRYPKEKEDVTKINFEPWHFRYVGTAAAAYLHENDLTLEEFYNLL